MALPKTDTILEMKDHIAAYVALVAGEFKDEIKELTDLRNTTTKLLADVATVKKMEAAKAAADLYVANRQAEGDAILVDLKAMREDILKDQADLATREKDLIAGQYALGDAVSAFDTRCTVRTREIDADNKASAAILEEALAVNADAAKREAALKVREETVARKMDVLKNL